MIITFKDTTGINDYKIMSKWIIPVVDDIKNIYHLRII